MDSASFATLLGALSSIVIAVISYIGNRQGAKEASESNAKMIAYRIEQLEAKQDKHNQMIERMFKLEGRMNEAEHDIRDLKGVVIK